MKVLVAGASGFLGRELEFHPGLAIMALFEERIDPWKGATQGYHSLEYLGEGVKFEVLWSPPAVLATLFSYLVRTGLDAVLIGPHDLSCSLGIPEQYDHPRFDEAVRTVFRVALLDDFFQTFAQPRGLVLAAHKPVDQGNHRTGPSRWFGGLGCLVTRRRTCR